MTKSLIVQHIRAIELSTAVNLLNKHNVNR